MFSHKTEYKRNKTIIELPSISSKRNHEKGSDEFSDTEASTILGMERTWFAVAIVSTLITLAGVVAGMVMCFCKQRTSTPRHLHNANNAQNHPPVGFPCELKIFLFIDTLID